ncbi:MAG TPA: F0F1 ATP synthase subunit B [Chitinophagales bacterium]|nr:F0F1 ATP synthase subunit B [Chitinophagales bacterium]
MQLLTPALGLIFWTALIFLIVLFILKKYAWGPILKALDVREHTIDDALKTAERTKQEMANLKSEHEALLAQAKQERMNIIREANQIKEQIVTDARDKAKEEASRIMNENLREIDNRKMEAITDLKNQVGDMVLQISEKILRRELSDKPKQEDYINQLINETKLS